MTNALFITSNGFGLGHITRCMSVARRLPQGLKPIIFTLSGALRIIKDQGFYVEYFRSRDDVLRTADPAKPSEWHRWLGERLTGVLDEYDPAVVVFDGTHPYRGMLSAFRERPKRKFVWERRGMWRPGRGHHNITLAPAFDLVIEPGEFAGPIDKGITARQRDGVARVEPIVFCDEEELLDREQAEREIGLAHGRKNVLIHLGQGTTNDIDTPTAMCVERLRKEPDVQVVVTESTLWSRSTPLPEGVGSLSAYPLSRFYRAFDFCVCASGYNTYHELIAYGIPGLYLPNVDTPLDDQVARARYAEQMSVGRNWELPTSEDLERCLADLLDDSKRSQMVHNLHQARSGNGAVTAARLIAELATERGDLG